MLFGGLLVGGTIIYFTRLLNNYVDYCVALKCKRDEEIAQSEECAKQWVKERPRRSAPGDRALRNLVEVLDNNKPVEKPELIDSGFSV